MEILDYSNKLPKDYNLFLWGDTHIGSISTSYEAIKTFTDKIKKDKKNFWAMGGDLIEGIAPNDKRFSLLGHAHGGGRSAMIGEQKKEFIKLFQPIANRGLWVLHGNHEHNLINMFNIVEDICERLNIPYGTYMAKINMGTFKILDWHGRGIINPMSGDYKQIETNRQINLKRKLRHLADDCDIMAMHHVHQLIIHEPDNKLCLVDDGQQLQQFYQSPCIHAQDNGHRIIPEANRWYLACGSGLKQFVQGHSTYAEIAGYRPSELGCIKVKVKDHQLINCEKVFL